MLAPGENLRSLTGLRGIAALAVVFHHAAGEVKGETYFRGQPMVDIFFVLSGFVMGYVYLSKGSIDWKAFAVARFARIYPLHIATAAAMAFAAVAYASLTHQPWPAYVNPVQALRELTLTMAMPVVGAEKMWNFPAWSISVEWWVYFTVFPLLAIHGHKVPNRWAILLFLLAAIALAASLHLGIGKPTRYWPPFFRAIVGFVGGWLSFRIASTTSARMPAIAADAVFVAVFAVIYLAVPIIGQDAWFLITIYPLMVFALATTQCRAATMLASRPIEWLGQISFSIYLIHPIILNALEAFDAKAVAIGSRANWIMLAVPLTVLVSAISHAFFERPLRTLFRKRRLAPDSAAR